MIPPDMVKSVLDTNADGYVINMTLEQTRRINPNSIAPVNAVIPWKRVKELTPEMANGFHICLFNHNRTAPQYGVICFWAPSNF